jgi:DNA-damage-inducible protein D
MTNNEIEKYNETTFDSVKHIDEFGNEYWEARELQRMLDYKEWRFFEKVINKAQIACDNSNNNVNYHFGVYSKMVRTGDSTRPIIDYKLSRYACYLVVQNGNSSNKKIALVKHILLYKIENKNLLKKNMKS